MQSYTIYALVNYPEAKEISTPQYDVTANGVLAFVSRLLREEKDGTSFVLTIVPKQS